MLNVVFMGTPSFALPTFKRLTACANVVAVVCQPDRAKDRKGRYIFSPIKSAAMEMNLPVYQFEKIRKEGVEILKSLAPDLIVTCAYGQILSQEIIDIPKYGILNVHASLLPKYRGSSPLQWTLINGDKKTGVTIMKTDIGMDTGDVLAIEEFEVPNDMYIDGLFEKASNVGAELLCNILPDYVDGKITPTPQNDDDATKCVMLKKEDARIDWTDESEKIRNKIRGLGYGYTFYNGEMLKIYRLDLTSGNGAPGEIIACDKEIKVACGKGAVVIGELQLANKKRLTVSQFLNGAKIKCGEVLTID